MTIAAIAIKITMMMAIAILIMTAVTITNVLEVADDPVTKAKYGGASTTGWNGHVVPTGPSAA